MFIVFIINTSIWSPVNRPLPHINCYIDHFIKGCPMHSTLLTIQVMGGGSGWLCFMFPGLRWVQALPPTCLYHATGAGSDHCSSKSCKRARRHDTKASFFHPTFQRRGANACRSDRGQNAPLLRILWYTGSAQDQGYIWPGAGRHFTPHAIAMGIRPFTWHTYLQLR